MPIDRDEMNRRLIEEFRIEAAERLATLQETLLAIEQAGADAVPDLEAAMRQAHTLKGAAQSIGLERLGLTFHAFETGLGQIGGQASPVLLDLLLWVVDQFQSAVTDPGLEGLTWDHVHDALSAGRRPTGDAPRSAVSAGPADEAPGSGGVETGYPGVGAAGDTDVAGADDVRAGSSTALHVAPELHPQHPPHPHKRASDNQKTIRVATPVVDRLINEVGELLVTGGVYSLTADELQLLGTELRACRSQIRHALSAPESPDSAAWLREELDAVSNQIERWAESVGNLAVAVSNRGMRVAGSTSALHASVMETRMLPASALFRRYPRLVRDLSHELDRPAELVTEGDDCSIDWVIIERIEEPILHLIRNALVHGLESASERSRAGKPATGRVTLRAQLRGHMVVVEVEDDGAGLDLEAIHQRAVERGMLPNDERRALSVSDAIDLLFSSGFSTLTRATGAAGRGVGLDVVKRTVEQLGGAIDVHSEPGRGTRFSLSVPITLATFRGILVRARGALFALPQAAVARVVRFAPSELQSMGGRECVRINNEQIAVASLAAVLGLPDLQSAAPPWCRALVVRAAEKQVALLVDEIVDHREMVVKSLGYYLRRVPHYAGATILGDGSIVPILHVADCVRSAIESSAQAPGSGSLMPAADGDDSRRRQSVLVVDDSLTTRTLERSILESEGFRVGVAVDGREAQELLERQHFDLVVSDIQMPQMDGLQLTRWIRAEPRIRHLPVVLVSALDTPEDRTRGLEAGADAYIGKRSFDQPTLIATIRRLL